MAENGRAVCEKCGSELTEVYLYSGRDSKLDLIEKQRKKRIVRFGHMWVPYRARVEGLYCDNCKTVLIDITQKQFYESR